MVHKNPDFVRVPETVLKHRKTVEQIQEKHAEKRLKNIEIKKRREANKQKFFHAEDFVKAARAVQRSRVRDRKFSKVAQRKEAAPSSNLLFVIRLRGVTRLAPDVERIMRRLGLHTGNEGVFVRASREMLATLRRITPYIVFGSPNADTVRELLTKHAHVKVEGKRVGLGDNTIVEKQFGAQGLVCVEDMIHELVNGGPAFDQVNAFLWPFKLTTPQHGVTERPMHILTRGQSGERAEEAFNELVKKML